MNSLLYICFQNPHDSGRPVYHWQEFLWRARQIWHDDGCMGRGEPRWVKHHFHKLYFWLNNDLEVVHTQSSTCPGFKPMTFTSWQYILRPWDACPCHSAIRIQKKSAVSVQFCWYVPTQTHVRRSKWPYTITRLIALRPCIWFADLHVKVLRKVRCLSCHPISLLSAGAVKQHTRALQSKTPHSFFTVAPTVNSQYHCTKKPLCTR